MGDAAVVKAVLAGAEGLDEPQRAVLCAQAAMAAGTHDVAASGYVPGAAPSTPQEAHLVRVRVRANPNPNPNPYNPNPQPKPSPSP